MQLQNGLTAAYHGLDHEFLVQCFGVNVADDAPDHDIERCSHLGVTTQNHWHVVMLQFNFHGEQAS